jgi:uncharacterized membrane protein
MIIFVGKFLRDMMNGKNQWMKFSFIKQPKWNNRA